ncbi:MAG: FeoB-associated Cys-rich membrane protein [Bacteroidota bacterium]|nr:FeoB-associated Cys-rich membrane protein [Bacteroidota bacterium]
MTSKDIILYAVIIAAVGFSLYRRYVKSKQGKPGNTSQAQGTSFPSSKDDEYEPYSKK